MPAATDQQMQAFADQRLRPFAELLRAVRIAAQDHSAAIDDVYSRAVSNSRWTDNRNDGPPHLLMSGNSASPDDMLVLNTAMARLLDFFNGTLTDGNKNEFAAQWAVLQDACVRAVSV